MTTQPRQTEHIALPRGAYSASPARRHPLPTPVTPAKSLPASPTREPVQPLGRRLKSLLPLFGYVALAMVVVSIGLAYISGYMLVMKERNREGSLQKFFKQEDDIRTRNQELIARLESKHNLETMALQSNMIHTGDRPKFTVGMAHSFSAMPSSFQSVSPPILPVESDEQGKSVRTEIDATETRRTTQQ